MTLRVISFRAATEPGYGFVAASEQTGYGLLATEHASFTLPEATPSPGQGVVSLRADKGRITAGVTAETTPISFELGGDLRADVQAVTVSAESDGPLGVEGHGVAWALHGLEQHSGGTMRLAWAALGKAGLLLLVALRPADAGNHAEELVGAARIGTDGQVRTYVEPLLSTEYDPAGRHRRASLELWSEEGPMADRGAGTKVLGEVLDLGGRQASLAAFDWRITGSAGPGGYELLEL